MSSLIQMTILLQDIMHATSRNHNRSTSLERSVIDYWRALTCFFFLPKPSPAASAVVQNVWKNDWTQESNTLDGSEMRTRQKQVIATPGDHNTTDIPEQDDFTLNE